MWKWVNSLPHNPDLKKKAVEIMNAPLPAVFSALSKRKIIILATVNLSSANAFNLVTSKNLFDKGLNIMVV